MRTRRHVGPALPIVVLAAGQVGHLLVSDLRGGPLAVGGGAHGYVPALTTVVLGAAGAAVLAGLLAIAAAHMTVTSQPGPARRPRRRSFLDLFSVLFALQLALFVVQEVAEAAAHGVAVPDVTTLLLWGCLGQLPAALLGALALRWLGGRVEAASRLLANASGQALAPRPALAPAPAPTPPCPTPAARRLAGAVSQRGPPLPLLDRA
ncbi:MAG TPA: hypothetical protein VOB72_11010 [Candidatus Dormibacteraeota bacterium]|nr:hypothetical protein [Candidatus Dormibacteraeota bacterium]